VKRSGAPASGGWPASAPASRRAAAGCWPPGRPARCTAGSHGSGWHSPSWQEHCDDALSEHSHIGWQAAMLHHEQSSWLRLTSLGGASFGSDHRSGPLPHTPGPLPPAQRQNQRGAIGAPDLDGERASSSCSVGSLLTSTGLHSPKSDSFMCPLASSSRLSGLISLRRAPRACSRSAPSCLQRGSHFRRVSRRAPQNKQT